MRALLRSARRSARARPAHSRHRDQGKGSTLPCSRRSCAPPAIASGYSRRLTSNTLRNGFRLMVCRFTGRTRGANGRGRSGGAGTRKRAGARHHVLRDRHGTRFPALLRRRCDIAVIEVGLGGRFDSTMSAAHWCRSSQTSASTTRHNSGNTLEEIAFQKAGIIKHCVPVVSGVTQDGPREVVRTSRREDDAPLWESSRSFRPRREKRSVCSARIRS